MEQDTETFATLQRLKFKNFDSLDGFSVFDMIFIVLLI